MERNDVSRFTLVVLCFFTAIFFVAAGALGALVAQGGLVIAPIDRIVLPVVLLFGGVVGLLGTLYVAESFGFGRIARDAGATALRLHEIYQVFVSVDATVEDSVITILKLRDGRLRTYGFPKGVLPSSGVFQKQVSDDGKIIYAAFPRVQQNVAA
ncbi:MAG: hypothetical protein HY460_00130 [Parcubacteria group bacterium]|nr:hypothetical protein [Parcubacteria group bacterium]